MKLTTLLLTVNLIQIAAIGYSQNSRFDISFDQIPLKEALSAIENQSNFKFVYRESDVENKTVSLNAKDMAISAILDELLANTNNQYRILDNNLVIIASNDVLQQTRITGTVTDGSTNEPLIGVNVSIEGAQGGAITDVAGKYSIEARPEAVLVFSYIGYMTERITVASQAIIDVQLTPDIQELEEVVVVGYGTQKKSDITGSVVSVTNEQLTEHPVTNVFQALQGKAAGVDITTNLRPGELGKIFIRGTRSLKASNAPLYVVDGVPLMSGSGIETLNEKDIESLEILKDASATAIYGSRGANGVILVTTKRGTEGKFQLSYNGSYTSEKMIWRSEYMDVAEFIEFSRWGAYYASYNAATNTYTRTPGNEPSLANDGTINYFTAEPVAWANIQRGWEGGTWDPSRVETFDWIGVVTQPAYTHEHTLSASGGTETMKAYASIGYLDNQGTTKGQEYQRYTVRTNVELNPKDWITFGAGINGSWQYQDYGQSRTGGSSNVTADLIAAAARIEPYSLPYDDNGNKIIHPGGKARVWNVIDEWNYSTNQRETLRILGSLFTEVKLPIKGLKYRMNFGPDFRFYRNGWYNDSKSIVREGSAANGSVANVRDFSWTIDNLLYYDKTFGDHTFGATLLQTASKWTTERSKITGQGIEVPSQYWYSLGYLSQSNVTESGFRYDGSDENTFPYTERTLASYMARFNYNFRDKYLLTLSGRWDGASQLAEGNKWSFFPSAAIAWRISEESFMDDFTWIDNLKLRLGIGTVGNSAVPLYSSIGKLTQQTLPFGKETNGAYTLTTALANPDLGWETTTQYNLALDFSVLRGRINGSIEGYTSNTTDLILEVKLPSVSGYTTTIANVGETSNKGIDITINATPVKVSDFTWDISATAAYTKEKIESLMNGKEDMVADEWFIGEQMEVFYDYEYDGIWQDTPEDLAEIALFNANGSQFAPGKIRIKDQNDDYRLDGNNDRKVIGNERPRWTIGLSNTFTYKNFELSAFITGRLKYMVRVGEGLTGMYGDQRELDYWTPLNTDAEYQRPFMSEAGGDQYAGTYYKDDSWIKIRNISLGYNVPMTLLSKAKISNLKLYAQIQNAGMLWSKNNWRDSEYGTLYYNRGFVFGVNVGF